MRPRTRTNGAKPLDPLDRDRLAARLVSGHETLLLDHDGAARPFGLRPPAPRDRLAAADAAARVRAEAAFAGVPAEADVLALLRARGLWTDKDDYEYKTAAENVDKLKVGMYLAKSAREREAGRAALEKTRGLLRALAARRGEGRERTAEGLAEAARVRALVGRCLERPDGSPAFPHGYEQDRSSLLDAACAAYAQTRAAEAELREVARTEPWRSVWSAREACGGAVFAGPASALTDEQRLLVVWTRMYDAAAQDPDGPDDAAAADDDLFDGWLIHRRRQREGDAARDRVGRAIQNEKIAGAGEVFVCAAAPGEAVTGLSPAELAAVEGMNTPEAARLKAQRAAQVAKAGALHEAQLADVNQMLKAEVARRAAQQGKF